MTFGFFIFQRILIFRSLALQQQILVYKRSIKKPNIKTRDRLFWVLLVKVFSSWADCLEFVQPQTVLGWHKKGFKLFWKWKSKPAGRPSIELKHIKWIRRISSDHPEWGEDKIAGELKEKFEVEHSPTTVGNYMVKRVPGGHPSGQTWKTFIKNHSKEIWSCDFLVQRTFLYRALYVFVIMEIGSRKIIHFNLIPHPTLEWVKQQFRETSWYDEKARFLIHDNDKIFGQFGSRVRSAEAGRGFENQDKKKKAKSYRCELDLWLDKTMAITGIPIPYYSPNLNPYSERLNGSLRRECLDYFFIFSDRHAYRVLKEYIHTWYNRARHHQGLNGIPDPDPELLKPRPKNRKIQATPILNGLNHDYRLLA